MHQHWIANTLIFAKIRLYNTVTLNPGKGAGAGTSNWTERKKHTSADTYPIGKWEDWGETDTSKLWS